MLPRLLDIGFQHVGKWHLKQMEISYTLDYGNRRCNSLFAFVTGTEALYIRRSSESLEKRLCGYLSADATEYTNRVVNRMLSRLLRAGVVVEIYSLPDHGLLPVENSYIDLASILEDSLISELKPTWNTCLQEI